MKNVFAGGSSAAMAALAKLNTTVGFLTERQEAMDLSPAGRRAGSAYVWRRVFLKGKQRKG